MSYYTTINQCPNCESLEEHWVIPTVTSNVISKCASCEEPYRLDQTLFKIIFNNPTE